MVLYLARKRANRPIDYSYANVRRDTFHLKLEAIEHLQHSINILNDRIGPEDLTEDEILEAVDILLNAGDEPVPPMEPQRMHSTDVGAMSQSTTPNVSYRPTTSSGSWNIIILSTVSFYTNRRNNCNLNFDSPSNVDSLHSQWWSVWRKRSNQLKCYDTVSTTKSSWNTTAAANGRYCINISIHLNRYSKLSFLLNERFHFDWERNYNTILFYLQQIIQMKQS